MTDNILAQHKEVIARNQVILDKFKADNQYVSLVSRRKLVYGVGINDADYATNPRIGGKHETCFFYQTWVSMLNRCYSSKYHDKQPTYKGCTVCDEWHSFMAFKSWMMGQDYKNKQIDKDLLVIGNKLYSPETCIFVNRKVNGLMNDSAAQRGLFPQGVCLKQGRYLARVNVNGKSKHLGYFTTIKSAEAAYIKAKTANIIKVALEQTSMKLMKALIMHANYMRVNFECKQRMIN